MGAICGKDHSTNHSVRSSMIVYKKATEDDFFRKSGRSEPNRHKKKPKNHKLFVIREEKPHLEETPAQRC